MKRTFIKVTAAALSLAAGIVFTGCDAATSSSSEETTTAATEAEETSEDSVAESTEEENTSETTEETAGETTGESVNGSDSDEQGNGLDVTSAISASAEDFTTEEVISQARDMLDEGMLLLEVTPADMSEYEGFVEGFNAMIAGREISEIVNPDALDIGIDLSDADGNASTILFDTDENGDSVISEIAGESLSSIISGGNVGDYEHFTIPASDDGSSRVVSVYQFDSYENALAFFRSEESMFENSDMYTFTESETDEGYTYTGTVIYPDELSEIVSELGIDTESNTITATITPDGLLTVDSSFGNI